MGIPAFIALAATIFNSAWAVFVLTRDLRSRLHRVFFLWTTTVVLWNFGAYHVYQPQIDPGGAVMWIKILQLGVIMMPVTLFHLCVLTVRVEFPRAIPIFYAITAGFAGTLVPDWFVSGVRKVGVGYWAEPGPAFWLFLIFFLIVTLGALFVLWRFREGKTPLDRMRITSLFVAIGILWIFGGNDLLPILGITNYPGTNIPFYPLGNIAAIFYVMAVAYSVLQHQLLDIHVTLGRAAAHLVRFGFLSLIGLVVLSVFALLLPREFTIASWVCGIFAIIVSGIAASLLFPRLFGGGMERLERKILGDHFEYHDRVRSFIESLHAYSDANLLFADLDELFEHTIGIRSYKMILLDEASRAFSLFRAKPEQEMKQIPELQVKSPVFVFFENKKGEYLACGIDAPFVSASSLEWQARKQLEQFDAEFCFPFFFEQQPFGLLLLGKKESGDPYTATDIHLLARLATNLSVVLNQIRLHAYMLRQQELDLLGRMSRGLAHDLNNLLTPVWTLVELVGAGAAIEDISDEILPVAMRNLKTMRAYIREALFFSENMRPDWQLGRLDLVAKQAIEVVERKRAGKQIKIVVTATSDALVEMDEILIQRLLGNVLSNAIDASPEHSIIRVDITSLIQTDVLRDWYRVRITDQGEGISSENLSRIALPYFTTKNRGDGTRGFGLGLAICRKIVHLHGGSMNIFSQVGRGTTVQIDLPSRQLKPAASPQVKTATTS